MNPARSLAPALFVGGWALAQLWLFIVFPIVGGLVGGLVYRYVLEVPAGARATRTEGPGEAAASGRRAEPSGRAGRRSAPAPPGNPAMLGRVRAGRRSQEGGGMTRPARGLTAPYGSEGPYNAFRLADALALRDEHVEVFLMGDAV